MKKIRNVIRQVLTSELSDSEIAVSSHVSRNTVKRYREIAYEKEYRWEDLVNLNDSDLDAKFNSILRRIARKRKPDYSIVHGEMKQKGMTLLVLWEEYCTVDPARALSYSQFTENYRAYKKSIDRVMRQTHEPGKKTFVDFSGLRPKYINKETGEEVFVELFVGVLGFSNYTFATCVPSQSIASWVEAHNRMFEFFGGATAVTVPDNLKSAVIKAGREPIINATYYEQAAHYSTSIIPARPYKPKDKAPAELAVQIIQRWCLARLRNYTFFSIQEINHALADLMKLFNEREFKRVPGSRRSLFVEKEMAHLLPLPSEPYVFAVWTGELLVDNSYHVCVDKHWYSVPHELVGKRVTARTSAGVVEFFHQHQRVASHVQSTAEGEKTTISEHQPVSHRSYAERTPEKFLAWAQTIGPGMVAVVEFQLNRSFPALGLPSCDALQKLFKAHGAEVMELAAQRAVEIQSCSVKTVKSLISTGRYRRARVEKKQSTLPTQHCNLRGGAYFSTNTETPSC